MRWLALLVALVSCNEDGGVVDGGIDLPAPDLRSLAACCPPDSTPGCCMHFGGWTSDGSCFALCDGIPVPTDHGWKVVKDDHACPIWTNPRFCGPTSDNCCGSPTADMVALPTD